MPSRRARTLILSVSVLFAVCLTQLGASGRLFLFPMQSEHVREAYFLGRSMSTSKLDAFLSSYVRIFPIPLTGPSVQSIEFRTPYDLVVQRTMERNFNYSAQDAQRDYSAHPGLVLVHVVVWVTPIATQVAGPIPGVRITNRPTGTENQAAGEFPDSWYGFHFKVAQDKRLEAKKLTSSNLMLFGADEITEAWGIDLEFDAAQFSATPVSIDVTAPDGKTVHAAFDLAKLK